jgi:hypothetical protein
MVLGRLPVEGIAKLFPCRKRPIESFLCIALFWLFSVLVLSMAVLVLVIDATMILILELRWAKHVNNEGT